MATQKDLLFGGPPPTGSRTGRSDGRNSSRSSGRLWDQLQSESANATERSSSNNDAKSARDKRWAQRQRRQHHQQSARRTSSQAPPPHSTSYQQEAPQESGRMSRRQQAYEEKRRKAMANEQSYHQSHAPQANSNSETRTKPRQIPGSIQTSSIHRHHEQENVQAPANRHNQHQASRQFPNNSNQDRQSNSNELGMLGDASQHQQSPTQARRRGSGPQQPLDRDEYSDLLKQQMEEVERKRVLERHRSIREAQESTGLQLGDNRNTRQPKSNPNTETFSNQQILHNSAVPHKQESHHTPQQDSMTSPKGAYAVQLEAQIDAVKKRKKLERQQSLLEERNSTGLVFESETKQNPRHHGNTQTLPAPPPLLEHQQHYNPPTRHSSKQMSQHQHGEIIGENDAVANSRSIANLGAPPGARSPKGDYAEQLEAQIEAVKKRKEFARQQSLMEEKQSTGLIFESEAKQKPQQVQRSHGAPPVGTTIVTQPPNYNSIAPHPHQIQKPSPQVIQAVEEKSAKEKAREEQRRYAEELQKQVAAQRMREQLERERSLRDEVQSVSIMDANQHGTESRRPSYLPQSNARRNEPSILARGGMTQIATQPQYPQPHLYPPQEQNYMRQTGHNDYGTGPQQQQQILQNTSPQYNLPLNPRVSNQFKNASNSASQSMNFPQHSQVPSGLAIPGPSAGNNFPSGNTETQTSHNLNPRRPHPSITQVGSTLGHDERVARQQQYRQELEQQQRELKARKQAEKQRELAEDRARLAQASFTDKIGTSGGGGAPVRNVDGTILTSVRGQTNQNRDDVAQNLYQATQDSRWSGGQNQPWQSGDGRAVAPNAPPQFIQQPNQPQGFMAPSAPYMPAPIQSAQAQVESSQQFENRTGGFGRKSFGSQISNEFDAQVAQQQKREQQRKQHAELAAQMQADNERKLQEKQQRIREEKQEEDRLQRERTNMLLRFEEESKAAKRKKEAEFQKELAAQVEAKKLQNEKEKAAQKRLEEEEEKRLELERIELQRRYQLDRKAGVSDIPTVATTKEDENKQQGTGGMFGGTNNLDEGTIGTKHLFGSGSNGTSLADRLRQNRNSSIANGMHGGSPRVEKHPSLQVGREVVRQEGSGNLTRDRNKFEHSNNKEKSMKPEHHRRHKRRSKSRSKSKSRRRRYSSSSESSCDDSVVSSTSESSRNSNKYLRRSRRKHKRDTTRRSDVQEDIIEQLKKEADETKLEQLRTKEQLEKLRKSFQMKEKRWDLQFKTQSDMLKRQIVGDEETNHYGYESPIDDFYEPLDVHDQPQVMRNRIPETTRRQRKEVLVNVAPEKGQPIIPRIGGHQNRNSNQVTLIHTTRSTSPKPPALENSENYDLDHTMKSLSSESKLIFPDGRSMKLMELSTKVPVYSPPRSPQTIVLKGSKAEIRIEDFDQFGNRVQDDTNVPEPMELSESIVDQHRADVEEVLSPDSDPRYNDIRSIKLVAVSKDDSPRPSSRTLVKEPGDETQSSARKISEPSNVSEKKLKPRNQSKVEYDFDVEEVFRRNERRLEFLDAVSTFDIGVAGTDQLDIFLQDFLDTAKKNNTKHRSSELKTLTRAQERAKQFGIIGESHEVASVFGSDDDGCEPIEVDALVGGSRWMKVQK